MNLKKTLLAGLALMTLQVTVTFADHQLPIGSLSRLRQDTYSLDSAVRYSSLRYQVKMAVSRFAWDVERFVNCTQNVPPVDDHDLIPEHCEHDMHNVRSSFYPVERYLYDTYYDYPNVYRRYLRVRNDISALPN